MHRHQDNGGSPITIDVNDLMPLNEARQCFIDALSSGVPATKHGY